MCLTKFTSFNESDLGLPVTQGYPESVLILILDSQVFLAQARPHDELMLPPEPVWFSLMPGQRANFQKLMLYEQFSVLQRGL